jgi:hypothetical protein
MFASSRGIDAHAAFGMSGAEQSGVRFVLTVAFFLCTACVAQAQAPASGSTTAWVNDVTAQVSADLHPGLGGVVGFAYAVRPKLLLGGGGGFARRELGPHFEDQILDAIHADAFARYLFNEYVHADFGLTYVFTFATADDFSCPGESERPEVCGRFAGAFSTIDVGYRYVFVSARVRAGVASYEDGHQKLGVEATLPMLRFVASF